VTRGKPFAIKNDVVWTMLLDYRDAFVIHFASWVRGMYEKGGFLRQIQAHYLRDLRAKWKAGSATRSPSWIHDFLAANHAETFSRLFPAVKTALPKPGDVEAMRDNFVDKFEAVVGDRDSNRAHPYEQEYAKNSRALDLREMRALLTQAQVFLNDMRHVGCRSHFSYGDRNWAPVDEVAVDLVDDLLWGPRSFHKLIWKGRPRAIFYDERHTAHDQLPDAAKVLFNGNWPGDDDDAA
jgi:hypothetical protein